MLVTWLFLATLLVETGLLWCRYEIVNRRAEMARFEESLGELAPLIVKITADIEPFQRAMQQVADMIDMIEVRVRQKQFDFWIPKEGPIFHYVEDDLIDSWRYVWGHVADDGVIDVESRERDLCEHGLRRPCEQCDPYSFAVMMRKAEALLMRVDPPKQLGAGTDA